MSISAEPVIALMFVDKRDCMMKFCDKYNFNKAQNHITIYIYQNTQRLLITVYQNGNSLPKTKKKGKNNLFVLFFILMSLKFQELLMTEGMLETVNDEHSCSQ